MKRILTIIWLATLPFKGIAASAESKPVNIFIYEVPGLIWFEGGRLTGPAFEGFDTFLKFAGISPVYSLLPSSRASFNAKNTKNNCAFPTEEYVIEGSSLKKVLMVAAVPAIIYSTTVQKKTAKELRGTYAVAPRAYLYHQKLPDMRINTILVDDIKTAIKMIKAKRVDYLLLSEIVAKSLNKMKDITLYPVLKLDEGKVYFACNDVKNMPDSSAMLEKYKAFLASGENTKIYKKYGMESLASYQYHPTDGRWSQAIKQP